MQLKLERVQLDSDVTLGALYVDQRFECWVCEDAVRELPGVPVAQWKIKGQTAIPFGMYDIDITLSARFGVDLPLLLGVPGFDGIRIHPGNTAVDTDGCLLPGKDRLAKSVGRSRDAFNTLFGKLRAAKVSSERIVIHIVKEQKP